MAATPIMPASDNPSSTRNGLRPPVVSTHAENGMRSSEPDNAGMATRNPTAIALRCMDCWKRTAVGPKSATAANPTKNPIVAPVSPARGVPLTTGEGAVTSGSYVVSGLPRRLVRRSLPRRSANARRRGPADDLRPAPQIRVGNRQHVHETAEREDGDEQVRQNDVRLCEQRQRRGGRRVGGQPH